MEITLLEEKTYKVNSILARVGVRYWEDSQFNGVEAKEDGSDTPLRNGDYWCIEIMVENGQIKNWPVGTTANIHYKSCDDNEITLCEETSNEFFTYDGYVPNCLDPYKEGYGDYVILNINEKGIIENWKLDFSDLENYNNKIIN